MFLAEIDCSSNKIRRFIFFAFIHLGIKELIDISTIGQHVIIYDIGDPLAASLDRLQLGQTLWIQNLDFQFSLQIQLLGVPQMLGLPRNQSPIILLGVADDVELFFYLFFLVFESFVKKFKVKCCLSGKSNQVRRN